MTWGQRAIWKPIQWLGEEAHYFNLSRVLSLPSGLTAAAVVDAIGQLLSRHEALRTHFSMSSAGPRQDIAAEGSLAVPHYRSEPGGGQGVAERLALALASEPFQHDQEWPVRCALVLDGERPTHLALVFSHLAVDFWAVNEVEQDLRALFAGTEAAAPTWHPQDQARYESDGPGAARGRRALDYWRRTLRKMPLSLFAAPAHEPAGQRFVRLRLESTAAAVAATVLSRRCEVSTGAVLLAATSVLLGRYTGQRTVGLQLIARNRPDDRSRRMVGAMIQNSIVVLDVHEGSFDAAVRAAFHSALNSYRFSQYDPLALDTVIAEVTHDFGGTDPDLTVYFNDARLQDHWDDLPQTDGSAGALRKLMEQTEVVLVGAWERQDTRFFAHTSFAPDRCHLHLLADTAFIPQQDIELLLRGVERLLVEAAVGALDLHDAEALAGLDRRAGLRRTG
ncbi:condensation domain-containing protein [Streptomyces sp. 846.5]|nr:condensation domain-containing protein [Streptomyces sp. 846.5]TDU04454.1 condensation domain-containing protein [Streptomyces sp. 846.5]